MQPPLIPLNEDHKWKLLSEIINSIIEDIFKLAKKPCSMKNLD